VRHTDQGGRPGATPPAPGRPASFFPAPLLAAFALCAALFALITWQVTAGGPLRTADEHLGRAVAGHGPAPLMELLTQLGSMAVALPVLAAVI
jgi:hypothetical protein